MAVHILISVLKVDHLTCGSVRIADSIKYGPSYRDVNRWIWALQSEAST